MKYFIITTDDDFRPLIYEYDDELQFNKTVGRLISLNKLVYAIHGTRIPVVSKEL